MIKNKIKIKGVSRSVVTIETVSKKTYLMVGDIYTDTKQSMIVSITSDDKASILKGAQLLKPDTVLTQSKIKIPKIENIKGQIINGLGEIVTPDQDNTTIPVEYFTNTEDIVYSRILGEAKEIIWTGIKAIDFFTPMKRGDLTVITGMAGAGKSVLLESILSTNMKQTNVIFSGIGERNIEVVELFENLKAENKHINKTFVATPMGSSPAGTRVEIFNMTKSMINQSIINGKNTLTVVDNMYRLIQAKTEVDATAGLKLFRGFSTNLDDITYNVAKSFGITKRSNIIGEETEYSSTGIFTNLAQSDDIINAGAEAVQKINTSSIKLKSTHQYYPKIDFVESTSKNIAANTIGNLHYDLNKRVMTLLKQYEVIKEKLYISSVDELSEVDRIDLIKAQQIEAYFSQRLSASTKFTSAKSEFVHIDDVLDDVGKILTGSYIDTDVENFEYIGKF